MRRKTLNIPLGFVISILMMLSTTQQVLAQCNWATRVTLSPGTFQGPGLTASGDRLILTWAKDSDPTGVFNSMISFDGVNWVNRVIRSDFPRIGQDPHKNPSMTYSTPCGAVYAAWSDANNNMWATKSGDGINWEAARLIIGSALSAPALRGDNSSLPIGFAFSSSSEFSGFFKAFKGKFNCDFSNVVFPSQDDFFNATGTFEQVSTEPLTPAWTGALGTTELSAVATGAPIMGRVAQITHQVNSDIPGSAGSNWSNNGLAGAVNPNDGTPYIAWTCHPDILDTCSGSGSGAINILNVRTGAHMICTNDRSFTNPAMTFFQGKIWVAWADVRSQKLIVASLNPF